MATIIIDDSSIKDGANINPEKLGLKERVSDIPLESCRQADGSPAPQTAADPDLALKGGTFATNSLTLQTEDVKTLGAVTRYTHFEVAIPQRYNAGSPFTIRVIGGHQTTIADTTSIVSLEAYLKSDAGGKTGSDLVTNPASRSINSLSAQSIDFVIDPSNLTPGARLTCRLGIVVNDGAGATAVIGYVSRLQRVLLERG